MVRPEGKRSRTTVVIPCYREDRFLGEALDSVRDQTRPVAEIIVIDDGSPTPLKPPANWTFPALRWIRTENQGLGAARNVGLRNTETEFVAFLDADDFWDREKISHQEDLLDRSPQAVACYTQCVKAEGFFPFGPFPDPNLERDKLAVMLWSAQFFPPSSVMMRTSIAKLVNGFREGLSNGEDLDMWFRLFDHGEIIGVPQPLTWYRIHPNQITKDPSRKILGAKESRRGIIEKYSARLIRGGVDTDKLWHAYRNEIYCEYYRRNLKVARRMLWDYWCDHPSDLRTFFYFLLSNVPPSVLSAVRGKI